MTAPAFWVDAEAVLSLDPSFITRTSQVRTVELLHNAFRSRTHVAVEAPTGTGKAFATLLVADQNQYRTVISTATRALQEQIRRIDVPHLQELGLLTDSVVVLQGRARYYCSQRAELAMATGSPAARPYLKKLLKAEAGLREDMPAVPDWVWEHACSDSDACRALECNGSNCTYTAIRDEARTARIVVVNHSVLLADAKIKSGSAIAWGKRSPNPDEKDILGVLGPYRSLIIDEGHALEAAAESFGERRVTVRGMLALATRISKTPGAGQAIADLAETMEIVKAVIKRLPQEALIAPTGRLMLGDAVLSAKAAATAVRGGMTYDEEVRNELMAQMCFNLAEKLKAIDEAIAYGFDEIGPRAPSAGDGKLTSQLVDASGWLQDHLFNNVPTAMVSGTLAVPGRRDYVTERVGLHTPVQQLPSAFDLGIQRMVYVTPRVEDKSIKSARVGDADVEEIQELLDASRGRALVLFPAVADLKYVYDRIHNNGHTILGQGVTMEKVKRENIPVPPAKLAQQFTDDIHSVLLATRSFFEGVDFPGESCSLVIVARFPNLRPDDPLTLARRNLIEKRGGNPWIEYQEPAMQLLFRQAAGRAIRRVDDRGVVAVIDPRAASKSYGKRALMSLTPSQFTSSVDDVQKFLA